MNQKHLQESSLRWLQVFVVLMITVTSHCDYSTDMDDNLYKKIFLGGVVKNRGVMSLMLTKSKSRENSQKRVKFLLLHFLMNILPAAPAHNPIQNMSWMMLVED